MPGDLWPVEVDKGQISQVISNLIMNANQAMPEGGIIKVSAENIGVGKGDSLPLRNGKYVKISIEDQGIGMPEEHIRRIFDPYFTTKPEGNGLGLAISHSIIKKHGGHIAVESQLGIGSVFFVYLPASTGEILPQGKMDEKPIMGRGRILVIDDEDIVTDLALEMLSSIGYKAAIARDGAEALELYRKARELGHPFNVVIVDLTIPGGIGGAEIVKKIAQVDPEVKAIASSGYSDDPIMSDFRKYGFSGVLAKPYRIRELSEVLHKVVNGTTTLSI
jgi:CheY-like chemotaxis protein